MINALFRTYNYYSFGEKNSYGQTTLIKDENNNLMIQGSIKMAIIPSSISVQDNINYKDANYVGFNFGNITDKEVIDYDGQKLKVLYVNTLGRYKQIYMKNYE